jgi:acyl-CoA synthetase (AMP-forming)/AMP-acid ligase II
VTSPFAATGYLDNPAASAEAFRDGRYVTGDLGVIDARGVITLTGRTKLLINRGGFKVNPYEVEDAIRAHPKVRDVAVVGRPGRHGDDVVWAYVVASPGCTAEEIVAHCGERLADFKIPARVEFRDTLPAGPTGKVLRGELR